MSKYSFGWKKYFEPTPKRIRVLGDSLAAAGVFASSIAVLNGHPKAGTTIMIIAIAGKFISNFFTDENDNLNSPSPLNGELRSSEKDTEAAN